MLKRLLLLTLLTMTLVGVSFSQRTAPDQPLAQTEEQRDRLRQLGVEFFKTDRTPDDVKKLFATLEEEGLLAPATDCSGCLAYCLSQPDPCRCGVRTCSPCWSVVVLLCD